MISIDTEPSARHAAYNDINWVVTSANLKADISIISVSDSGGDALFTSGTHNLAVGDTVAISGSANYDGAYTVATVPSGTTFKLSKDSTNVAYIATDTGTGEINPGFQIKAEVIVSGSTVGTKYIKADSSDNFNLNAKDIVKTQVSYKLETLNTLVFGFQTDCFADYTVKFTEQYYDEDLLLQDDDDTTSSSKRAFNLALQTGESLTDYEMATGTNKEFLTDRKTWNIKLTDEVQVGFITTEANIKYRLECFDSSGASIGSYTSSALSASSNRGVAVVNNSNVSLCTPTGTVASIELKMLNSSNVTISETLTFNVISACFDTDVFLYYLNKKGSFDAYRFIKSIKSSRPKRSTYKVDGVNKTYFVDTSLEWELMGKPETEATINDLNNLWESVKVLDINFNEVQILSNDFTYSSYNLIEPSCSIRVKQNEMNQ